MSDSSEEESTRPRRSQRARKAPSFFQPEVTNINPVLHDESNSDLSSSEEDLDDDEDVIHRNKRTKKSIDRPAHKRTRTKTNLNNSLPPVTEPTMEPTENYLYEAILDPDTAIKELAQGWLETYQEDPTEAMREFVNFVIKSSGCEFTIENHDIADRETAAESLAQVQEAFRHHALATYPLVAKKPQFRPFRKNLLAFVGSLTRMAAERGLLYDDEAEFMENIQVWISAMSSSNLRPFRHTAVVIFLTILTHLCELYVKAVKLHAQNVKNLEIEKTKRSRRVREKVQFFEKNIQLYTTQIATLKHLMRDIFDTVFIHRYRDVDPRIRSECIHELGKWMDILPEIFFEGQYLRYLGWVLSDTHASTRHEVIRSLSKLYRQESYISGFRQFTERFCPRMIEMAQSDSDPSVRVAVLDLLVTLRQVEFLEEEDITKINHLVFDADYRVRKAAAKFFVNHVKEVALEEFQTTVGGNRDDYFVKTQKLESPWVAFKVLGSILNGIQPKDQDNITTLTISGINANLSQLSIAAATIWEVTKEVHAELNDWSSLARQLLFDFSSPPSTSNKKITSKQLKNLHKLCTVDSELEVILLQVLHGFIAASGNLPEVTQLSKKRKDTTTTSTTATIIPAIAVAEISHEPLIRLLPRLLDKFAYDPQAISTVLKIHSSTDITLYRDLRQEDVYADLLSKICRQFLHQDNEQVLQACVECVAHAQKFAPFADSVKPQIQDLTDEVISAFNDVAGSGSVSDAADSEARDNFLRAANKLRFLAKAVNVVTAMNSQATGGNDSSLELLIKGVLTLDEADSGYTSEGDDEDYSEINLAIMTEFTKRKLFLGIEIARFYGAWSLSSHRINEEAIVSIKAKLESWLLRLPVRLTHPEWSQQGPDRLNDIIPCDLFTQVSLALVDLVVTAASFEGPSLALADDCKTKLLKCFLLKERHYAYFADLDIEQVGPIQLSREEEDFQDEDLDHHHIGASDKTDTVNKWYAETELCQFAGKLNLCVMLDILPQEPYGERLVLNQKSLGPLFEATVTPAQLKLDEVVVETAETPLPLFDKATTVVDVNRRRNVEYFSEIENTDEE